MIHSVWDQGIKDERPRKCGHGFLASLTIVMNPHVMHQQVDNAAFHSALTLTTS